MKHVSGSNSIAGRKPKTFSSRRADRRAKTHFLLHIRPTHLLSKNFRGEIAARRRRRFLSSRFDVRKRKGKFCIVSRCVRCSNFTFNLPFSQGNRSACSVHVSEIRVSRFSFAVAPVHGAIRKGINSFALNRFRVASESCPGPERTFFNGQHHLLLLRATSTRQISSLINFAHLIRCHRRVGSFKNSFDA